MNSGWILLGAYAAAMVAIGWKVKAIANTAYAGFTDEELAEYRALSSEQAHSEVPEKFQPLREVGKKLRRLWLIAAGITMTTAIVGLYSGVFA